MNEIIVYRNPAEAMMWQAIMSGEFFVIFVGIIIFFIVFLLANRILTSRFGRWGKRGKQMNYLSLVAGAIAGMITIAMMWV